MLEELVHVDAEELLCHGVEYGWHEGKFGVAYAGAGAWGVGLFVVEGDDPVLQVVAFHGVGPYDGLVGVPASEFDGDVVENIE